MPIRFKRSTDSESRSEQPLQPKKTASTGKGFPLLKLLQKKDQKPAEAAPEPAPVAPKPPAPHKSAQELASSLRSEMMMASQAEPEQRKWTERRGVRRVLFPLLGVGVVLVLGWLLAAGPGRPVLEQALVLLARGEATSTPTITPTQRPTLTPLSPQTETPLPTATPTRRPPPTATPPPPTEETEVVEEASATPEAGCREATAVGEADVGQTLCVQGVVLRTTPSGGGTLVVFSDDIETMVWLTYDVPAEAVEELAVKGRCLQTTGEIQLLGTNIVLIFDYSNLPEECPNP
ncbi:MAG: hypothetical protein JW726_03600 [Anaerolineales bacterium]|nr:hypothetical protein [Anaerolineales bacterium]